MLPQILLLTFTLLHQSQTSTFVRPISNQWPWLQWTTPEPPTNTVTTTTTPRPFNNRPPPPVTFVPPSADDEKMIMIQDPSDGRIFYIPVNLFYERFSGVGNSVGEPAVVAAKNPILCDVSSSRCWPSGGQVPAQVSSTDTGFRTSAYYRPNSTPPPTGQVPAQVSSTDTGFRTSAYYRPNSTPPPTGQVPAQVPSTDTGFRTSAYYRPNSTPPPTSSQASRTFEEPAGGDTDRAGWQVFRTFQQPSNGGDEDDYPTWTQPRNLYPWQRTTRSGTGIGGSVDSK